MAELEAHGIALTLPPGWEGRVFRRPSAGEVAAAATDGIPAPPGEITNAVVQVATIPLAPGVGDFASGAVEDLGPTDALIVLFEYDAASVDQPLFATRGAPRSLEPSDFSPSVLQRALAGQAGAQVFFQEAGRAFCLYVVLGAYNRRSEVLPAVNAVLATLDVSRGSPTPGTSPPTTTMPVAGTVIDAIRSAPGLGTFAALLGQADLAGMLGEVGPLTVLAPVDGAFGAARLEPLLDDAVLRRRTLEAHIVRELITPPDLTMRQTLSTLAGSVAVTVLNGNVAVAGLEVERDALECRNGIVFRLRGLLEAPR